MDEHNDKKCKNSKFYVGHGVFGNYEACKKCGWVDVKALHKAMKWSYQKCRFYKKVAMIKDISKEKLAILNAKFLLMK